MARPTGPLNPKAAVPTLAPAPVRALVRFQSGMGDHWIPCNIVKDLPNGCVEVVTLHSGAHSVKRAEDVRLQK